MTDLLPAEGIDHAILTVRGRRVMLDADLAELYGVETRVLNQAVKRNITRFPGDFMFQLTAEEKEEVITNRDHLSRLKYSPALPFAFTEHGAVMLSAVLKSPVAVEASIEVARAFVRIRRLMALEGEIRQRLEALETRTGEHDSHIAALYQAFQDLMAPPDPGPKRIGFKTDEP